MIRTTARRGNGKRKSENGKKEPTLWERDSTICNIFTIYAAPTSPRVLSSLFFLPLPHVLPLSDCRVEKL